MDFSGGQYLTIVYPEARMSEYQIYEFLARDRLLSAGDMAYVRTLSSRVQPTPTSTKMKHGMD
jgi:hypothetical protein